MSSSTSVSQKNFPVFRHRTASCSCGCPRLANSNVCSRSFQSTDTGIGALPFAAACGATPAGIATRWLAMPVEIISRSAARHVHARPFARVPPAADGALDLRRQLQQQPVIGLFCDRLDAERQAVLMGGERQRDRGDAAEIGERGKGKI